jgi:pimeloyl-ACP methyl ester carboxylesterase
LASAALVGACGGSGIDARAASQVSNSAVKPLAFQDVPAEGVTMVTGGSHTAAMRIAVREYGNPNGKPIVFIHGFAQNHLCWYRQLSAPELSSFRLIAVDLRGHGDSDKTLPAGFPSTGYAPDDYADDLAAVIQAKGLFKPVLVGWSYGGFVIGDYVRVHGAANIGGLNFVGAACRMEATSGWPSKQTGPGFLDNGADMLANDVATNVRGTINFLDACAKLPISQDDFATLLASNMLVPSSVRLALILRPDTRYDETVFAKMPPLPTLVTQGAIDDVVMPAAAQAIAAAIPGSRLSLYAGAGHLTFFDDTARFNRELASLRAGI